MNNLTKHITRDMVFMIVGSCVVMTLFGMFRPQTGVKRTMAQKALHALPMDKDSLERLGFFPLFSKIDNYVVDPVMVEAITQDLQAQGISQHDIDQQIATLMPSDKLTYHMVNAQTGAVQEGSAAVDAPLVMPLGLISFSESEDWGWCDRFLMQYKCLNQFELAEKTSLSPALCASHALNNARLIQKYVMTGQIQYLNELFDLEKAANFLLDINSKDWISTDAVKENLQKMKNLFKTDNARISVLGSVILLDGLLPEKQDFMLFDAKEYEEAQAIKRIIRKGLLQKDFYHILIIGNEESTESHGHYFAVAIVKTNFTIQYLVLDTLPNVYHLQPESHENKRLLYMIEQCEQGKSAIDFTNIRMKQYQQLG